MFIFANKSLKITSLALQQFARRVIKPPTKTLAMTDAEIAQLVKEGKSNSSILSTMMKYDKQTPSFKKEQINLPQVDPNLRQIVEERAKNAISKEKEDSSFKQLAELDQDDSKKSLDIFIEKPKKGEALIKRKKESLEPDIFEKTQERYKELCELFDPQNEIDRQYVKRLVKEELFQNKKESELNAKLEAEKKENERKKELKAALHRFNNIEWDEDVDHGEKQVMIKKDLKKMKFDEKIDKIDQLNQEFAQKFDKNKDYYFFQRTRTSQNMDLFVEKFLYGNKRDLEKMCPDYPIRITETFTNESCSVMWIFWELMDDLDNQFKNRPQMQFVYEEFEAKMKEKEKLEKKVNEKLNKYSGYLSGEMCRALGLRYSPDIRFKISKMKQKQVSLEQDMHESIKDVVDNELQEKFKEGKIQREITAQQYQTMLEKTKELADEYIGDQTTNKDELFKKDKPEGKGKKNRDQNGKKKKSVKPDRADKFWKKL